MPQGISIHVGVNEVDPAHYGTRAELAGCENDARAMQAIADAHGYRSHLLLTAESGAGRIQELIADAADTLQAGDTLFFSYAGHGAQVPDTNGDEADAQDETWCVYDRMLVDDELYALWGRFREGVQILMLSDSCHSGTVAREISFNPEALAALMSSKGGKANGAAPTRAAVPVFRALPHAAAERAYAGNRELYDGIQARGPGTETVQIGASVLLISGCQDNQTSLDGVHNGLFTENLLGVWQDGAFKGSYEGLHRAVSMRMPVTQSPNLLMEGRSSTDFRRRTPFALA